MLGHDPSVYSIFPKSENNPGTQSEIVLFVASNAAIQELRVEILRLNHSDRYSLVHSVIDSAARRIQKAIVGANRRQPWSE